MTDADLHKRQLERQRRARKEAEQLLERKSRELFEVNQMLHAEIKERTAAERTLRLRQRAIESSVNAILITRFGGSGDPIEYVNPAFERITGYAAAEVLGRDAGFLQGKDRDQPGVMAIRAALHEQREGHAVLRNYRKDGSLFWNDLHIAPVRDEAGAVTHFVGVMNDISETRGYQQQLERQANYDTLTGLANRNLLQDRLKQAVAQARRASTLVAVAFLDLDHFKNINDGLGHTVGDEVLKVVAARLRASVRESDTVARLGGDEFVLILPGLTDMKDAAAVAGRLQQTVASHPEIVEVLQRVLDTVAEPVTVTGGSFSVSCSIGLSVFPHDGEDVDTLLKNADAAMYRAKERGRNNFQFYTGEMNARIAERLTLQAQLRHALGQNEFVLHYQPKVDLASGRICGIEALIRWQRAGAGLVPPNQFIPILEETGMIIEVGRWVMEQAVREQVRARGAGRELPRIAVNVSQVQLRQDDFAAVVAAAVAECGAVALDLEITESLIMRDIEANIPKFLSIRDCGLGIAIDDFGTGYSSLSYLAKLPVDVLKIDRAFIANLTSRRDDHAIVSTIISLAHSLKLKVVAEGVETDEQAHLLRQLRCDAIQGYLLTPPLPLDAYLDWAAQFESAARPLWKNRA
jgi:diguanylate cyclase (GGDEF)-like protein/PAS domain S-box-containing protein